MEFQGEHYRRLCAEILQLVLDNKLSPQNAIQKWPDCTEDYIVAGAFRFLKNFNADEELRTKDKNYSDWQILTMKRKLSQLVRSEAIDNSKIAPYSLRPMLEKPLSEVDELIQAFAINVNAKMEYNYRDAVSRIIYWREGRLVKYIEIGDVYDKEDGDVVTYLISVHAYRIRIPLMHFWNTYFGGWGEYNKNIGILETPIEHQKLTDLLNNAYGSLKTVFRKSLKVKRYSEKTRTML